MIRPPLSSSLVFSSAPQPSAAAPNTLEQLLSDDEGVITIDPRALRLLVYDFLYESMVALGIPLIWRVRHFRNLLLELPTGAVAQPSRVSVKQP
jgi:hypothetical protein